MIHAQAEDDFNRVETNYLTNLGRLAEAEGESGDPASKHFRDQIDRYASSDLRNVYFYPDELAGHIERTYRPGK